MRFLRLGPVLVAALFTLIALFAACGEGSADADPSAGEVRPLVSNFAVSTGQDTAFTLSEHAGDVVVLYFSFPG